MSAYARTLPVASKQRYLNKLEELGFKEDDPFLDFEKSKKDRKHASSWVDDASKWPDIEFGDIYTYFIDTPGPFTRENMRAYRSLEAYMFYHDGWVQTCEYKSSETGFCIIRAKVHRSQAVTLEPHRTWVAIRESDHSVECGHCTCMAGLGEVCSHTAGILFKIEASVRFRQQTSCTSLPCQWNQTFVKKLDAVPLGEIKFKKPKRQSVGVENECHETASLLPSITDPTSLLQDLKQCAPTAVVFSVVNPKRTEIKDEKLPLNIVNLYDENASNMTEIELKDLCAVKFNLLNSTKQQNLELEKCTRKQSKCGLWLKYRLGRITSSNFREAVKTSVDKPSKSLIKKIVHGINFKSAAVNWGNNNEDVAIRQYFEAQAPYHKNLKVSKCWFFISDEFPFLGTSPDRIVECDCCGRGTVEVKCPYKFRNIHPCLVSDKTFCLEDHDCGNNNNCDNALRYDHAYFYQVQGQMGICHLSHCDFICYTTKGLHVERILFDPEYFQSVVGKLSRLYKECILPEVLTHNLIEDLEKENCQPDLKRSRKK